MAGGHDCVADTLHVVDVFNIRGHVCTTCLNRVVLVLTKLHGSLELILNSACNVVFDLRHHAVCGSRLQGLVRERHDRQDGFVLEAGVGRAFTGPVHAHERLEEVAVGQFLGVLPLASYGDGLVERFLQLVFIRRLHPLEQRRDVAFLKGSLREWDDRPIQRVAVPECVRRENDAREHADDVCTCDVHSVPPSSVAALVAFPTSSPNRRHAAMSLSPGCHL